MPSGCAAAVVLYGSSRSHGKTGSRSRGETGWGVEAAPTVLSFSVVPDRSAAPGLPGGAGLLSSAGLPDAGAKKPAVP
ncbi:UmuC protein [Streptomyces sp. NBRC 110611]|nr:UmuC protein [Streptomyces sp. NBRC 110611]